MLVTRYACERRCAFFTALLLLYCCFTAFTHTGMRARGAVPALLFCATALLLYCFTTALLLLYCVHTHRYVREALVCSEEKMRLQVLTN